MGETVHAEFSYGDVASQDVAPVCLVGIPTDGADAGVCPDGIAAHHTFADARGELVAKFVLEEARTIVAPGANDLTLTGMTEAGLSFSGTDTVLVIEQSGKRR